jgi:NDP-sugar pyrophosphorylase family protein
MPLRHPGNGTRAVVLAGGRGTRLAPYTSVLPKPLMPLDGRSILEVLVERLRHEGITDLVLSVGYLAHLIEAVFGDGSSRGVRIDYVHEREALGTAGPLRLVEGLDRTFVAMNGDLVTDLRIADLLATHRAAGNAMTIATRRRVSRIDYGVLEVDHTGPSARIEGFREKPEIESVISMGVYAFEPSVLEHIPRGRPFDVPQLVMALLEAGEPIGAHMFDGFWLDVGKPDDYARAVEAFGGQAAANGVPAARTA